MTGTNGKKTNREDCREQESVDWMEKLGPKFSNPGEPQIVHFSATFETAKACLELMRHRHFADC